MNTKNDSSSINFTDEIFSLFHNFIEEKTGLCFNRDRKKFLNNKIQERLTYLHLTDYLQYFGLITDTSPFGKQEFQNLLENLTTRETSFFRNPDHFWALEHSILPNLIEERARSNNRVIKLWSAGCSSGEEPYSLAIVLLKLITFPNTWDIEIFATDISKQAIETAKLGIYTENHLSAIDSSLKRKYFDRISESNYQVKEYIRNLIRFQQMNLLSQIYLANFDVIFCRNVIIYFSEKTRIDLINYFYRCLRPKGFLFLGHSEPLHKVKSKFNIKKSGNTLVFQK